MTAAEWDEYRRRLALREARRRWCETAAEWSEAPGRVWWWDTQRDKP